MKIYRRNTAWQHLDIGPNIRKTLIEINRRIGNIDIEFYSFVYYFEINIGFLSGQPWTWTGAQDVGQYACISLL
jgi:hypothetical protein